MVLARETCIHAIGTQRHVLQSKCLKMTLDCGMGITRYGVAWRGNRPVRPGNLDNACNAGAGGGVCNSDLLHRQLLADGREQQQSRDPFQCVIKCRRFGEIARRDVNRRPQQPRASSGRRVKIRTRCPACRSPTTIRRPSRRWHPLRGSVVWSCGPPAASRPQADLHRSSPGHRNLRNKVPL